MTTKLVALELSNPSVSVPCNGQRTQPGSLAQVIYMAEVIGALADGSIRIGVTSLTINEIAD